MAERTTTFTLPDDDIAVLRALAAARGTTVTAALRRAIATERFLAGEWRKGGKLLIEKADGSLREIVVC